MPSYDLLIAGGGAGAFAAAIRANELGARTAMINTGLPLGGTCVNVGCVPSKTLIHAASVVHQARHHGIPGIDLGITRFDFEQVAEHELDLVAKLRQEKYESVLQSLEHVEFIEGRARFIAPHEVEVGGRQLAAERFIVATGSTAIIPSISGIRETGYITHIEALRPRPLPKAMVVVGAGPVGLEFAQLFARFGTQVTLLQRGRSILPRAEEVLTTRLQEIFRSEGVTVHTDAAVLEARPSSGRKEVRFTVSGGEERAICDEILVATGKRPNTANLGLETIGVRLDDRGAVIVTQELQTSQPHVFAVGDVTNLPQRLETTAGAEGSRAAQNALTVSQEKIDYRTVPYTVFTDPELASVGYTEEEQMRELGASSCRTVSFNDVPRARIIGRTEGLIKMAVHPDTRRIMGVHILAPHAGEIIAEAMMLVRNRNTLDDVTNSLPMFPTLSEGIKLVATSFTKDIRKLSCCV